MKYPSTPSIFTSEYMQQAVNLSRTLESTASSCKMDTRPFFQLRECLIEEKTRDFLKCLCRDPKEHAQRRRHMGVLFNRSKVPILTQMMVEEISRFNTLLGNLSQGSLDLIPTCRALEADIVCK